MAQASDNALPQRLSAAAIDQLFLEARTHNAWLDKPVADETLHELIDLLKMAPTSANCSPARFYFVKSKESKQRLKPFLSGNNAEKTMQAPVCAIIGQDKEFYERLPELFPHTDARSWFVGNQSKIEETAFRNSTLQGAYLILAARALGLDCGPMSGFDVAGVEREFFAGTSIRANFLCNIGYGDSSALRPRSPRFAFEDMAKIIQPFEIETLARQAPGDLLRQGPRHNYIQPSDRLHKRVF